MYSSGSSALAALLALFMTGIELSFAMAVIGFVGFSVVRSFESGLDLLATDVFDMFSSYGLSVVPLFVLMGQLAFNAGIAKRLYSCANKFIGHVPGGLAMATVAGASAFKAICGSAPATAATFAAIAVPEMDKFGYGRKLSTGVVASVGTLGVLIPPSVSLIVFGIITEQSIGKAVSRRCHSRVDHRCILCSDHLRLVAGLTLPSVRKGKDRHGKKGLPPFRRCSGS